MDGQFLLSIVALLLGYEENSTIPTVRGCFICVNISLVIILVYISSFVGCAMAQTVSRRPVTAEARLQSQASPCGTCSGQSGTQTD